MYTDLWAAYEQIYRGYAPNRVCRSGYRVVFGVTVPGHSFRGSVILNGI